MEEQPQTIRLSALPSTLQASARALVQELDADGDGCIDGAEFVAAINALKASRKKNRNLTKLITVLLVFTLLLIGSIFGVSVAAARMAKDTETDNESGFLYTKSSGDKTLVKTGEAISWLNTTNIVDMTNDALMSMKYISMADGNTHFHVKGHARASSGEEVVVLVEGGTITFNNVGLINATGDALFILEATGVSLENDTSGRKLTPIGGGIFQIIFFIGILELQI